MADKHIVIPRTMCFVFNGDDVLLLKANSSKEWDGAYDPLGGHIENANREIEEESGLRVKDTKLRGIVHVSGFFEKEIKAFEDLKPILKHVLEMKTGEIFVGTSQWDGKDKLLALSLKIN